MTEALRTSLLIAVAAGGISTTIAKSRVFASMRIAIMVRSFHAGLLVGCPYCITHWVVFTGVAIYRPRLVHSGLVPLDLLTTGFAIVTGAALISALLMKLYWSET